MGLGRHFLNLSPRCWHLPSKGRVWLTSLKWGPAFSDLFLTNRMWWTWCCVTSEIRLEIAVLLLSDSWGDCPWNPGTMFWGSPGHMWVFQLTAPGSLWQPASRATSRSEQVFKGFQASAFEPPSLCQTLWALQICEQINWWFKPRSYRLVCYIAIDNHTNNIILKIFNINSYSHRLTPYLYYLAICNHILWLYY